MPTLKQPKYLEIKRRLLEEVRDGTYAPGDSLPSEAELLKRFGVSRPTVVRSLQDLAREGVIYRHQGKGSFVAEQDRQNQNGTARNGTPAGHDRRGAAAGVPLFVSDNTAGLTGAAREVLLRLMRGAEAFLSRSGRPLLLRNVPPGDVTPQTRQFLDAHPAGPALMIEASFSPALLHELRGRGWSVVSLNEPSDAADSVCIDQEAAGYLAARYLIQHGRRRVALFNGPAEQYWGFAARLRGYRAALREAGIEPDAALELSAEGPTESETGRALMRQLLGQGVKFDAVVGTNDSKTLGAWAAAEEAGLDVPGDVAFVSIDNTVAARADKPLTSVTMPFEAVGREAAKLVLEQHEARRDGRDWFQVTTQLRPALAPRTASPRMTRQQHD